MIPSSYYGFALRASQGGFGSPLDQSGTLNDPQTNTTLFPAARLNNTAYNLGDYRAPAVLNGKLYKCTTAGTSASSEPAGMAAAAIGATVADGGSLVWTVERGPWFITAASGMQHITAIASGLLPAYGGITLPAIAWDMLNGDSLILRVKQAWNFNATDARTAMAESAVLGNRHLTTNTKGFRLSATGSTSNDLKLAVSDGTNIVVSGHVATTFNRKPGDGTVRDTVFMIDGQTKTTYAWTDGVPYSQAEMFSGTEYSPHQRCLNPNLYGASVTGSTLSTNNIILGGIPGDTVSRDFGVMALDVLVLPGRALPVNTQAIASFFYSRGVEALLPASLLT